MAALFILFFFLEAYTAFLAVYILIQLLKKKKLPWRILLAEFICLVAVFYCKYLVGRHDLIFTGNYTNDPEHWESGLANLMTYTLNLFILIMIFIVVQILFWVLFFRKTRKLNDPGLFSKEKLDNFLNKDESAIS